MVFAEGAFSQSYSTRYHPCDCDPTEIWLPLLLCSVLQESYSDLSLAIQNEPISTPGPIQFEFTSPFFAGRYAYQSYSTLSAGGSPTEATLIDNTLSFSIGALTAKCGYFCKVVYKLVSPLVKRTACSWLRSYCRCQPLSAYSCNATEGMLATTSLQFPG
jgi:hypothetical protein